MGVTNSSKNIRSFFFGIGARGGAVGRGTALPGGGSRIRFALGSLKLKLILPPALRSWNRLSL
jgi:hypothetical protein